MTKEQGNCYEAAFQCVQQCWKAQQSGTDPSLAGAKIFLVHGSVITNEESIAGKRIDHAWMEVEWPSECVIFEFANKKQDAMEKSKWVRELHAEEEKKYTPEEAYIKSKPHYGPWHREPREPI